MSINSEIAEDPTIPTTSVARNVIMAVGAFPLMMVLSTALIIPVIAFATVNIVTAISVTIVAEILVIFLAISITNNAKRWKDALYLRNFRIKNVVMGFFTGVSLFAILQAVAIATALSGDKLESSDTSAALGQIEGLGKYVVLLLIVPFIVPIVEELLFRGVIFGFIKNSGMENQKLALILGILVSTVMFGAAHFQGFENITGIIVVFLTAGIGAVNCWLVYKTDSIYTAFACHIGYNLANSAMSLLATS